MQSNSLSGGVPHLATADPVDPVVLIDNTLAIAMGALLTMACNCKGHNLHSPCHCRGDNILCCCNCRGHNLLSLVIAMGLFHYPWQVAGTMGCSSTCSWHLWQLPLSMTSLHQKGLSVSTGSLDQNLFSYCDRNLPPASKLSFVSIGYVIKRSVSVGVSLGITISRWRHCHQCPRPLFVTASTTLSVPCLQKIM